MLTAKYLFLAPALFVVVTVNAWFIHSPLLQQRGKSLVDKEKYFQRVSSKVFMNHVIETSSSIPSSPLKVAIIGSGNWGTAVARRVGLNILDARERGDETFANDISMWVYEESFEGRQLTDIINNDHINPKYLPDIQLPLNVKACPDIIESCKDADVLLFITPHQFLKEALNVMKGHVKPTAVGTSLIKGLDVSPTGPKLLSEMIRSTLSLDNDVAVLMGANLASDVSTDSPVESTVACKDPAVAKTVAKLFHCDSFRVDTSCPDVATVEICGALKNVVAMGAGFCDALESVGSSTKAAVLRRGIFEMGEFCRAFGGNDYDPNSMLSSCTIADVIASSYGGRNYKCAKEFAKRVLAMEAKAEREEEKRIAAAYAVRLSRKGISGLDDLGLMRTGAATAMMTATVGVTEPWDHHLRQYNRQEEKPRFKRESALFMHSADSLLADADDDSDSEDTSSSSSDSSSSSSSGKSSHARPTSVPAATPASKFYIPATGIYEINGSENDDIRTVDIPTEQVDTVSSPEYRERLRSLWVEVGRDLLKGQKLQGLGTCDEVIACLHTGHLLSRLKEQQHTSRASSSISNSGGGSSGAETDMFALFKKIYGIARLGESPRTILEY